MSIFSCFSFLPLQRNAVLKNRTLSTSAEKSKKQSENLARFEQKSLRSIVHQNLGVSRSTFSKQSSAQMPLHELRTNKLKQLTDRQYQRACRIGRSSEPYIFQGKNIDYIFCPAASIDTCLNDGLTRFLVKREVISIRKVLSAISAKNKQDKPVMLDIGCGYGRMINQINRTGEATAYGLTAEGFETSFFNGHDPRIRGNAEMLLQVDPLIKKKDSLDLITSNYTFMHLVDPLGTLTQAYELLKPGGIMFIDMFSLPGLNDGNKIQKINQYLQEKGFDVLFVQNPFPFGHTINCVILRKTEGHPKLDLPVQYTKHFIPNQKGSKQVVYKLDEEKIKPSSLTDTQFLTIKNTVSEFSSFLNRIGLNDSCYLVPRDNASQVSLKKDVYYACGNKNPLPEDFESKHNLPQAPKLTNRPRTGHGNKAPFSFRTSSANPFLAPGSMPKPVASTVSDYDRKLDLVRDDELLSLYKDAQHAYYSGLRISDR